MAKRAKNEDVKRYVKKNIRTYVINEWPADLMELDQLTGREPDWVKKCLEKGEEVYKPKSSQSWPDRDRPFVGADEIMLEDWVDCLNSMEPSSKIFKISVKQLPTHVEKWKKEIENSDDGIEEVCKTKDKKFTWVKVFGKRSLEREGRLMNHCAKKYYTNVSKGHMNLYSLRDGFNNPHVTIELDNTTKDIMQIKGNSNQPVKLEYVPYLVEFLNSDVIEYNLIDKRDRTYNLLIVSKDREVYYLPELPPGTHFNGDIDMSDYHSVDSLPDNLHISGNLVVGRYSNLIELPSGLVVDGEVDLKESKIKKIPSDMKAGRLIKPEHIKVDNELEDAPDVVYINI